MITMHKLYIIFAAAMLMTSCSSDLTEDYSEETKTVTLTTSVAPLKGENGTRANTAGTTFVDGDWIKLKIIAPYSAQTEFGETTYRGSQEGMWLLKYTASGWKNLDASDHCDINGDLAYSAAPNLFGHYEAQQTPYVYTASTWSEEHLFVANGQLYDQYCYAFHADQSNERDYQKSDLLWAQTEMATGTDQIHLEFHHKMAVLQLTLKGFTLSDSADVTLEGLPDIDGQEVVIGNKYATRSKVNDAHYGYREKNATTDDSQNGEVIGIASINEQQQKVVVTPINSIATTGTYRPLNCGSYYQLIVPPCMLKSNIRVVVRDGEKRYTGIVSRKEFVSGYLYPITVTLKEK